MSGMKRFAEEVMADMGKEEIDHAVLLEAQRRLDSSSIDSHKFTVGEYKMRNRRRAVILSDQSPNDNYQLVGAFEEEDGGWLIDSWTSEGRYFVSGSESDYDLMPPSVERQSEDLIAEYQKRIISAGTVQEGLEVTARFTEACRNSEPIPAWVLVIRAMAARIHLLEAIVRMNLSVGQCIKDGTHLTDCDDDGYCNYCGEQDEIS